MTPRAELRPFALDFVVAASTGLALGAVDALVDLSVRSTTSASPLSTWTVFGVSALAGTLGAWLVTALFRALARRFDDRGARALAAAATVVVLALPTLLACYRAIEPDLRGSLLALPAAAVVAFGTYWLARPHTARPGGGTAAALFASWIALGLACAAGAVALRSRASLGGAAEFAALGAIALAFAAASCASLRARSARALPGLCALALAAALGLGAAHLTPDEDAPAGKGRPAAGAKPRQIVLVVVDTLRADYLSCYSPDAPPTPAIDALAEQSLFFEHPRSSAPWTFPSVSSILTGLAPTVHLGLRPFDALPDAVTTLATRFSEAGFLTAAFVRNPALRRYTHIDRGFDEYHYQREPHPPSALAEVLLRPLLSEIYRPQVGAEVQTRRIARWVEEHKDRDFFLWAHYFDPHMAYNPPREFQPQGTPPAQVGRNFEDAARVRGGFFNPDAEERAWIRDLYAGEVRATDRGLGELFRALETQGVLENCTVVFTADHGDELWEHDAFEHGHTMYDEVLGVPLFLKLPGGALKGRVAEPVSNQSLAATLLEVAGVPYREADLSAPPLVRRGPDGALALDVRPRPLFSSGILYFEPRSAVVFEGFKYVQFHVSAREELFDLSHDPKELVNLAATRPELVLRGRELLETERQHATEMRLRLGVESRSSGSLDDDAARAMRALGYVK